MDVTIVHDVIVPVYEKAEDGFKEVDGVMYHITYHRIKGYSHQIAVNGIPTSQIVSFKRIHMIPIKSSIADAIKEYIDLEYKDTMNLIGNEPLRFHDDGIYTVFKNHILTVKKFRDRDFLTEHRLYIPDEESYQVH